MGVFDEALVGGGSGAATGAMLGSVVPGVGTGIGALVGGGLGMLAGGIGASSRKRAADAQRRAMEQAMARLEQFGKNQYANRMADLDKTLAFYQPAQAELDFMYGGQLPSTGQGPMSYVGPSGGGLFGAPPPLPGRSPAVAGGPPSSPPGPMQPPVLPEWMRRPPAPRKF